MSKKLNISIVTQLPGGVIAEPGIHQTAQGVIGVNQALGLMVMAVSETGFAPSSAFKAVEILLDDMQTNLLQFENQPIALGEEFFVTNCLRESLENINDYFQLESNREPVSTLDMAVKITAIQYFDGILSYISMGSFCCLLFSQGELKKLQHNPGKLGDSVAFEAHIQALDISPGDILIILDTITIEIIGLDYLHKTLSRFPESLEMVLRQINTRVTHSGQAQKPGIIMGRIDQEVSSSPGWIDKLRHRG